VDDLLYKAQADRPSLRRRRAEAKTERRLRGFFRAQRDRIVQSVALFRETPSAAFWTGERQLLVSVLLPALLESSDGGVREVVADFDQRFTVGVDYTRASPEAIRWARTRGGELIREVTDTTREQVKESVAAWIEEGEPLPALRGRLSDALDSDRRARLVAQTETTGAFAQGSLAAWKESGIVERAEWRTVRDERVCPICEPLDRQQGELGDIDGYWPPAHPGCRCFVAPVISREKLLGALAYA
jgi:SPP1 gp7 family putative phage head morphogenesis protein